MEVLPFSECSQAGPTTSFVFTEGEEQVKADTLMLNVEEQPLIESQSPFDIELEHVGPSEISPPGPTNIDPEYKWLEKDETLAVWVKWRGQWQAGIRCTKSDIPLQTLKAKPRHERKKYIVIFFPRTRNYSWADMLLIRPINESPQNIDEKTHRMCLKSVQDLNLARRFIMQKLAVSMLNVIEQLNCEALVETARNSGVWKEFALEASRCKGYSDLGKMLLKLLNMIMKSCLSKDWLDNSMENWILSCEDVLSAEKLELLKEELVDSIIWNEETLRSNKEEVGPDHKTWKQEVMKWFSTSHPIIPNLETLEQPSTTTTDTHSNEDLATTNLQISRKRAKKLECRRAEVHTLNMDTHINEPSVDNNSPIKWNELLLVNSENLPSPQLNSPTCEGVTVLNTKCKHRSLPGSPFCKKHLPKDYNVGPTENIVKPEKSNGATTTTTTPLTVAIVPEILNVGPDQCIDESFEICFESATKHSMYCEKHLPSWLKRARNGRSRIISKDVFIELLKSCNTREQKINLHKACEIFHKVFKNLLSSRNPSPRETQFEIAFLEASKDVNVTHLLKQIVVNEKDRLIRIWNLGADENDNTGPTLIEDMNMNMIKCSVCVEEFLDDEKLGSHFLQAHKIEAEVLFRGYVCALCLDPFTNKNVLESHVQDRHCATFVEECVLLKCIPCNSHYGNPNELWTHVLSLHSQNFRLLMENSSNQPPITTTTIATNMVAESSNPAQNRKLNCRFCGLQFDLLPDLGRHHQAAHMGNNSDGSRISKKGMSFYAYKRLNRPKFKKSYKIKNRNQGQTSKKPVNSVDITDTQSEGSNLSRLTDNQCVAVSKILFSEAKKTKNRPNNSEILDVARSTCCKRNLHGVLEKKYGYLPERIYLKAVKLLSEEGIIVRWHEDGFICPKGCKDEDPHVNAPFVPRVGPGPRKKKAVVNSSDEWSMDESHCVIDWRQFSKEAENSIVLCDDISNGKELVQIPCVVDDVIADGGSVSQITLESSPWGSFTYITKNIVYESVLVGPQSIQMGCSCGHMICSSGSCDHVYLFNEDYEDARDINGNPMNGRFPYDDWGRIILEEGYLVYECNQRCRCSKACPNRVLQNGIKVKLEIFKTEEKGWAVRTKQAILRGTFVCEYVGEVISEHEANERRKRYGEEKSGFMFEIDGHVNDMSRLVEDESTFVIDSTIYGNVSRYINHSCSPNLVNHQVLVESMDSPLAHIGFYANRDIPAFEELTYDFRYKKSLGEEGCACLCGASNCRGRLY